LLTPDRIKGIAGGARQVSQLPDPLGNTLRKSTLPNGIELEQISVPFGVIGMVYEARPNVTVDAAVILLMSGNAALLRGSSSAAHSNEILVRVMRDALATTSISPDVIQLVPSEDRETVKALLNARGKVDLVIPRGSAALIRMVVDESSVPTIETGAGVCHVYIDEFADLSKAVPIIINAQVSATPLKLYWFIQLSQKVFCQLRLKHYMRQVLFCIAIRRHWLLPTRQASQVKKQQMRISVLNTELSR
jgi:glutamate-5-semialdehyde dehydrogenase